MKPFFFSGIIASFLALLPVGVLPAFANRVTNAEYNQLQVGMTYEQVKKILGREGELYPGFNGDLDNNFQAAYRWGNDDGSGIVVAFDLRDRVIRFYARNLSGYNFGNNPLQPIVTPANFQGIKPGMTYREVTQVIGNPGVRSSENNRSLSSSGNTTFNWINPDGTGMSIVFDADNRVTSFRSYNLSVFNLGNNSQPRQANFITPQVSDRLQLGMTYQQIRNIIGSEGQLDSNFDVEAFEQSMAADEVEINTTFYQLGSISREELERENQQAIEEIKGAYKWVNQDGTGLTVVFNMADSAVAIYTFGLGLGLP